MMKYIQTHRAVTPSVAVIDLRCKLDFWRPKWIVLRKNDAQLKNSTFVRCVLGANDLCLPLVEVILSDRVRSDVCNLACL